MWDDEESGTPSWSLPSWLTWFSDAGGGSDFGNTGYFGLGASIEEGMTPGGLERYGISVTQEEIDAAKELSRSSKNPLSGLAKLFQDKEGNLDWSKLLRLVAGGAGAYLGSKDKQPPTGGGVAYAYKGPARPITRTVEQGPYGPIARYAATGGIMQAYASGGSVRPFPMQDGGFVMTKKAVDGAGGIGGLRAMMPETVPIQGPGHGTSDSIPAYIQGKNNVTPARVSNGEAYVPPGRRDTRDLYALMKALERRA